MQVHKLTLQSPCIQAAKPLRIVWHNFIEFIEKFLYGGKKCGIFIAWNGKSCDLDWFFKITKDENVNNLSMPQWCPFSFDPKAVITAYTGCKLNCKHSKLVGYGMESVWCYAMQQLSLPNAHNSLVDCRAQMDIVLHKHFHSYLNKKKSIANFDDIWLAKNGSIQKSAQRQHARCHQVGMKITQLHGIFQLRNSVVMQQVHPRYHNHHQLYWMQ